MSLILKGLKKLCGVKERTRSLSLDELLEEEPDPWPIRAYYVCWRFFQFNDWITPYRIFVRAEKFYQRGTRGWADSDTWSLDSYLSTWLPNALRYLKAHKHGVPMDMFEPGSDDSHDDAAMAKATARWDEVMDRMIAGFEAAERKQHATYIEELGPYPLRRPADMSPKVWKAVQEDRSRSARILDAYYQRLFEEGIALFALHYQSLWD